MTVFVKNLWEKKYDENFESFADTLGVTLAKHAYHEVVKAIRTPYGFDFHSENSTFRLNYSLDITQKKIAKKIMDMTQTNLEPFKSWLEEFSKDHRDFVVDESYFRNRMEVVGKRVKEVFRDFLESYHPEQYEMEERGLKHLRFEITGCNTFKFFYLAQPKNELNVTCFFSVLHKNENFFRESQIVFNEEYRNNLKLFFVATCIVYLFSAFLEKTLED
jgi:hypothetical protein